MNYYNECRCLAGEAQNCGERGRNKYCTNIPKLERRTLWQESIVKNVIVTRIKRECFSAYEQNGCQWNNIHTYMTRLLPSAQEPQPFTERGGKCVERPFSAYKIYLCLGRKQVVYVTKQFQYHLKSFELHNDYLVFSYNYLCNRVI